MSDLPKSKKIKSWLKLASSASTTYTASTVAIFTASTASTVTNSSSESAASTNPFLLPVQPRFVPAKMIKIFNKQVLTQFLKEFCPILLSDDVINNEAFVDGSVQSSKFVLEFLQNRKIYDGLC